MEEVYPKKLLTRMLEIYSPSGCEGEISQFLAQEMASLGFEVSVDRVGNVLGRMGRGIHRVLFCGHMDTVEGAISVKQRGKVLFGRGAVDAKSSLAALICGAVKHRELGGEGGSVDVLAVVDEEGKSKGMKFFLSNAKETYDYAVFGEPSGAYALTIGYKGRIVLIVKISTLAGHASAPQLFENAIYVGLRLVDRFRDLETKWARRGGGDFFNIPTLCVTGMRGGSQDNTVPSQCELSLDIRIPPSIKLGEVKRKLIKVLEEFRLSELRASMEYEFTDENEPYLEYSDSNLVKAFLQSIGEVVGKKGRLSRKTGTGDVNDFVKKFGTSSVVYGPGNSKLDHTPLENVSLQEYLDSIRVLEKVLGRLCSQAPTN